MSKVATKDFLLRAAQIAAHSNTGNTKIHFSNERLPSKKTLENYRKAMEEAVPNMLESGGEKIGYIVEILKDALSEKRLSKDFGCFRNESFYIKDFYVESAMLSIKKQNLYARIRFSTATVTVTVSELKFRGKRKTLKELQNVFDNFQNLLKIVDTIFHEVE